ncbi:hypothetical protein [Deinococcus sonorensis]|uniref:hypothetical protein n=1 Tax=Deinococcus sonorensis TaxID=309891 RepID=UPI0036D237FE
MPRLTPPTDTPSELLAAAEPLTGWVLLVVTLPAPEPPAVVPELPGVEALTEPPAKPVVEPRWLPWTCNEPFSTVARLTGPAVFPACTISMPLAAVRCISV